jgi:8-oxo-dGTP pyrophosphatase MutT (NUDIX family)
LRDRASGLGDLPGGRLGKGEIYNSWEVSLRREVQEELGSEIQYTINKEPIFCFPHYMVSDQCEGLGIAFQGNFLEGNIILSDEHDYLEWVNTENYHFDFLFKEHMLDAIYKFIKVYA